MEGKGATLPRGLANAIERTKARDPKAARTLMDEVEMAQAVSAVSSAEAEREHQELLAEMRKFYDVEGTRLGKDGDWLMALEQQNPDVIDLLIAKRTPEREVKVDEETTADGRAAMEAFGPGTRQIFIGPDDVALWTAAWPPLDAEGFQPRARPIPRAKVGEYRLLNWTRFPKGPFRPRGEYTCDIPGPGGAACTYPGSEWHWQLQLHQASRHPDTYRFRKDAEEQDAKAAQLAATNAQIEAAQSTAAANKALFEVIALLTEQRSGEAPSPARPARKGAGAAARAAVAKADAELDAE